MCVSYMLLYTVDSPPPCPDQSEGGEAQGNTPQKSAGPLRSMYSAADQLTSQHYFSIILLGLAPREPVQYCNIVP